MSARDELEAVIWRAITDRRDRPVACLPGETPEKFTVRLDGEFVDRVLAAADVYALAEYGVTADRRAAIGVSPATRKRDQRATRRPKDEIVVHWQYPGGRAEMPACGLTSKAVTTHDRDDVDCGQCKRSRMWQVAS